MRFLFTAVPGHGHVNPMVPLARALQRRSHDVIFLTGSEMRSRIEQLGFHCVTAGPTVRQMQEQALADPAVRALDEPWKVAAAIFAGRVQPVLDEVPSDGLDADLVVHDAYELTGPLLAATRGVPWLTHALGPRWPSYLEEHVGGLLARHWAAPGLTAAPRAGIGHHGYLEICPPSVRADDAPTADPVIELRPTPLDEPTVRIPSVGDGSRARIYATLGTVTNSDPAPYLVMLDRFAELDADVLLTTGGGVDPRAFGPLPGNVHVETYLPQAQVLASVDLVVCHGGSGTVLAALAHGRPVVLVAQGADQFRNAPFWARSGAVQVLTPDALTSEALADALAASRPGGAHRAAAEATAADIAAMPSPDSVASMVERLV